MKAFRPGPFQPSVLAACAALLLAGCASVPNVNVSRADAARIHRITILGVHEPANIWVTNMVGAAGAFGLVGGLVQAKIDSDHRKTLVQVIAEAKPSLSQELVSTALAALKADGFQASYAPSLYPKPSADRKSDDYTGIHVDSDAMLSLWYKVVGYISPPSSTHYEPTVLLGVRLVDARSGQVLFEKTYAVGYAWKIRNVVQIPADSRNLYKDFDDVIAHSKDAVAALKLGEDEAVKRAAWDFRN